MRLDGKIFQDAGVFKEQRTQMGHVQLEPAKKLAGVRLHMLQKEYKFAFILPHLLYDAQLNTDPTQEYALQESITVPAVYWDAEYPLIHGLTRPETQARANRIYAVSQSDMIGIQNCANASLFFNSELGRACRLEYRTYRLFDFNAPKIGSLVEEDVVIDVLVWSLKLSDRTIELAPRDKVNGVPKSYSVVSRPTKDGQSIDSVTKLITQDDHVTFRKAIEATDLDSQCDSADSGSPGEV